MRKIYTFGHSNRGIIDTIEILQAHKIKQIVDVRVVAKSSSFPRFSGWRFSSDLAAVGIGYTHLPQLGGLKRVPKPDSRNSSWDNPMFQAYADDMNTPEWRSGLAALEQIGSKIRTAYMCAESVPWRCHRSLITDVLLYKGWNVYHITSKYKPQAAKMNERAVFDQEGNIYYP